MPQEPSWLPHAADVWALLGAVSTVEQLVVAGDFLVSGATRRASPLSSIEELEEVLARFRGCTGIGRLHEALPLVRTGVESPAESRIRLIIINGGFQEPQPCCPVQIVERVVHADLGYPSLRIAIEHEGAYHFTGGIEQARRDTDRHEAMRAAGWIVLRTTALDLRNPKPFLTRLHDAIQQRTAAGS